MSNFSDVYKRVDELTGITRGFQGAVVLTTAVEAGIFTLLHTQPMTASEVAARLRYDLRAADILLYALTGMELLQVEDGVFRNAPIADELLVEGQPFYQGDIIAHNGHLMHRWIQLPQVLKTGKPAEGPRSTDDPKLRKSFILGMQNISRLSAESVAEHLELGQYHRMLDLGGGPGTYAITFCSKQAELQATVFDLPAVIDEITLGQIAEAGLQDRIAVLRGDYLDDDLGSDYDFVFISNIIHSLGPEDNRTLLRRVGESLISGGTIVIKDFLLDSDRAHPPFSSMFAVNMLVGTEAGRSYEVEEIKEYLTDLGFQDIVFSELTPQSRLLTGKKA